MPPELKATIKYHLKRRGLSQAALARQLGLSEGSVSLALNQPLCHASSHWPAILDALGLEVVIRPKHNPEASAAPHTPTDTSASAR